MHSTPHTPEARAKMSAARKGKPATWKHRPTKTVNGETLYRCGKCGDFKPRDGFYENKRTLLGIKSECRSCHSATSISSRDVEAARDRNRDFMRSSRASDPEKHRARDRIKKKPEPHKRRARELLNAAIRRGEIVRPDVCPRCERNARVTGHHPDYAKPLDVEWLCYECHGREHRKGRLP